jgi:hypothetical protein
MLKTIVVIGFVFLAFAACSIPQVEDPKCTESRETVRSFYAQHLADESQTSFTRENIAKKEKFLTPEFYRLLTGALDKQQTFSRDVFADSEQGPTGFKVGECKVSGENTVTHTVRLFWKIDAKPIVGDIKVEEEKRGDTWLISDFVGNTSGSLANALK